MDEDKDDFARMEREHVEREAELGERTLQTFRAWEEAEEKRKKTLERQ